MEDSVPTAGIVLLVVLLLVDVLFYGFGAAIQFINRSEVEKKAEDADLKSVRILHMIDNPTLFVNTVQLTVSTINVVFGFVLGVFGMRIMENSGAVAITFILLVYMVLTFGVFIPKKIGARYAEKWAYLFMNPVFYITRLLLPLTGLITLTGTGILKLFGLNPEKDNADVTEEEIISMVNEGHEQGVLLASEAEMITNIFEFGDKEAKDIMTHRMNITAIDGEMPFKDAIHLMLQERNSRYPLYEENIDHIVGIIHLKDALRIQALDENRNCKVKDVPGIAREAHFIPETRNIDALFKNMQSLKIQMVIVVDEYGQTAGLVAMEDILEEIVGNIMDEYDEDTGYIQEKGKDEYIIEGMTPLDDLEERLGISFEEEEFDTLNGFLISKMDKIPDEDEEFDITVENYNFKVLSVANKMIHTVLVTRVSEKASEEVKEPESTKEQNEKQ